MNSNDYSVFIEDLEKKYGDFKAVDKISLKVNKGEIFGFLGPNGAGKSTTIKMLTGLIIPSSGKAFVNGFNVFKEAEKIRENIGYMSQKFSLYDDLTVNENIDFYAGIYKISKNIKKQRKDWIIEISDIKEYLNIRTSSLSLGLKQRLALGCAIMHKPAILFLDEPTSGVDPISRRKFWNLIYEMAEEKKTVFVTTHYMDEADYCDRLAMIYNGKIIADGSPESLKQKINNQVILEIITDNAVKTRNILEKNIDYIELFFFGQGIHIVIDNINKKDEILNCLKKENINIINSEFKNPSLENVFVSLINRERK
ncbi:MAG: ABC transporter ATP-binding protein [Candidatus Muirbacterium halophilum]|nr:ABC transporter ATP-binding protein [Candidatus Muirbacterium halophilum]MCK9475828.1 ABC transporter ATP-binding protein [Candidatus Muirbacterium halophilum]